MKPRRTRIKLPTYNESQRRAARARVHKFSGSPKPYDNDQLFKPSVKGFWADIRKSYKPATGMMPRHKIQEAIDALAMSRQVLRDHIRMYYRSHLDVRTGRVEDKEARRAIAGLEYAAVAVLFMSSFFIDAVKTFYPAPRSKRIKKGRRRGR